jgi:hypothetical protein
MLLVLLIGQQPAWTGIGLGLSATLAVDAEDSGQLRRPGGRAVERPYRRADTAHAALRLIGALLVCAGWCALTLWHDAVWLLVALSFLITFGGSMLYAAMPNLVVEVAPPERTSEINGMSHVVRTVGDGDRHPARDDAAGELDVTDLALGPGSYPSPAAYGLAITVIAGFAAASIAVAFALPRRHARAVPAGTRTVEA